MNDHLFIFNKMNIFNKSNTFLLSLAAVVLLFATSCSDYLPTDREEIGFDSRFTQKLYEPVLGRTTVYSNNFFKGSTSYPVTFKIINPRRFNGEPAPELKDTFPVLVWREAYTGEETSLAEIQAKRDTEYHALWEIRPHSGQFVMWDAASSSFMHTQPDSGYIFDVELSNSGGRRYFSDFKLRPLRERPYEPSNQDPITGQATSVGVHPYGVINVKGTTYDRFMGSYDIDVYFNKTGNGHSLTFMFLDTLYQPIDPKKFNLTHWEGLVHGFDMNMTDSSVTYQTAYPIPLTTRETPYTTANGEFAHVEFGYSRLGFGQIRMDAKILFNFRILEKGDWVIVFKFNYDNPKFKDE